MQPLKQVKPEEMPELLRLASELYARDQAQIERAQEAHQIKAAAQEAGLPPEYLERAAALLVERRARRPRNPRRIYWVVVVALAVGFWAAIMTSYTSYSPSARTPVPPVAAPVSTVESSAPGAPMVGASLPGAKLAGRDLSRANMQGANLEKADLRYARLSGAILMGANLSGVDLTGADLSGADLQGANLSGANLSRADLSNANLVGASLRDANLTGTVISGTNLQGADLTGATYDP